MSPAGGKETNAETKKDTRSNAEIDTEESRASPSQEAKDL